ncbi:MAG: hypothetical protein KJN71_09515 [Acidimicrobiia bacterium]|nr:hypothetical protein [Acidimicrobiia bacterium]
MSEDGSMPSDLEQRNINTMINEAKRMHAEVESLRDDHRQLRADFTTLMQEFQDLKQKMVMDAYKRQMLEKGHGGTA